MGLENGYQTVIGGSGAFLSGGEAQRLEKNQGYLYELLHSKNEEATSDTADRTDFFDIRSPPRRVAGHVDERLLRNQGQDRFRARGNTSTTADALEKVDGDEPILDGKSSEYTDLHTGSGEEYRERHPEPSLPLQFTLPFQLGRRTDGPARNIK